jgi:hypothetical protein
MQSPSLSRSRELHIEMLHEHAHGAKGQANIISPTIFSYSGHDALQWVRRDAPPPVQR